MSCFVVPSLEAQDHEEFKNLKVLPKNIARRDLINQMLDNLRGLGLPRRQGEGCLYCHVGDMERPRDEWDYASDAKIEKAKARVMMAMVQEINGTHLSQIDDRVDTTFRVTCDTCHRGRTDPRPITAVLMSEYESGGVEPMLARHEELRARYYAAGVYDFRASMLGNIAFQLSARGRHSDAVAVASANVEAHPGDLGSRRMEVGVALAGMIATEGVEEALSWFDELLAGPESSVMTPGVLDGLGWGLFRSDRQDEAMQLFRRNSEAFPNEYIPHESLAFALNGLGEKDVAIKMFEDWLTRFSDHEMARRQLVNLQSPD